MLNRVLWRATGRILQSPASESYAQYHIIMSRIYTFLQVAKASGIQFHLSRAKLIRCIVRLMLLLQYNLLVVVFSIFYGDKIVVPNVVISRDVSTSQRACGYFCLCDWRLLPCFWTLLLSSCIRTVNCMSHLLENKLYYIWPWSWNLS